jgi:hypothetical protein
LSAWQSRKKDKNVFNQWNKALAHKVLTGRCLPAQVGQSIQETRKQMTKTTRLSCVMAVMLHLTFGIAAAADNAADSTEVQHARPTATNTPENQPKPQEEAAPANSSPSKAAQTQEEPDCNN